MTESKLNPLRIDPTRTTMLRKKFLSDMGKRFRALRGDIRRLVVVEDAFGLRQRRENAVVATQAATYRTLDTDVVLNTRWQFETDDAKVDDYREWLRGQVDAGILQVSDNNQATPWLEPHIRSSYKQGLLRAYHDTTGMSTTAAKDWSFIEGGKAAFLEMAFNSPEAESKIKLLSTRAYSQLEGVTASMDAEMSRILAAGMANGSGPGELGKQLNDTVSKLQRTRANTIARTETIYAHNEGQLDSFAAMNIDEVGVMAEWNTAHDGKVCALCRPLEGVVMTIDEARGLIPRHPNCRCAWIPADVGEVDGGTTKSVWLDGGTTGQVYAKDEADARIRQSLKAETPGVPTKEARAASTWSGAGTKIKPKQKPKKGQAAKALDDLKKRAARKQAATRADKIRAAKRNLPGTFDFYKESLEKLEASDLSPWEIASPLEWPVTKLNYKDHAANVEAGLLVGEADKVVAFTDVVWGNADITMAGIKKSAAYPPSKSQWRSRVYLKDGKYYPVDDEAANTIAAHWAKKGPVPLKVSVMDLDEAAVKAELMKPKPFEGPVYHTTSEAAVPSIMEGGGLQMHDGMFGKGVYFANEAGDSLAASTSAGSGTKPVMLKAKVKSKNRLDLDMTSKNTDEWDLNPDYVLFNKITSESQTAPDKAEAARLAFIEAGYDSIRVRWNDMDWTLVLDPSIIDISPAHAAVMDAKLAKFGIQKAQLRNSGKLLPNGDVPPLQASQLSGLVSDMLPPDMGPKEIYRVYSTAKTMGGFDKQLTYVAAQKAEYKAAKIAAADIFKQGLKKDYAASALFGSKPLATPTQQAAWLDAGWDGFQDTLGWKKPPAVKSQSYGVILFDEKGRILLRKPKDGFGGAEWTFAKGGGSHKLPATTALAELAEETGYEADLITAMPKGYKGKTTKTNFFIGKKTGKNLDLMDDETSQVAFMSYADAHAAIMKSPDPVVRARDISILNDAYAHAAKTAEQTLTSLGDQHLADIALKGSAIVAKQDEAAKLAKQSYKVKLGMAKKHYAKPKFGGGVDFPADYDTPDKLATSGINKVLSEKGWHLQTTPAAFDEAMQQAENIVEQKALIGGLKKAPKGTKQIPLERPPGAALAKVDGLADGEKMAMIVDGHMGVVDTKTIGGVVAPMTKTPLSKTVELEGNIGNPALMSLPVVQHIDFHKLRLSQNRVSTRKLTGILDNFDPNKTAFIRVIDYDGELIVVDGHHTLTAAWARGERPQFQVFKPVPEQPSGLKTPFTLHNSTDRLLELEKYNKADNFHKVMPLHTATKAQAKEVSAAQWRQDKIAWVGEHVTEGSVDVADFVASQPALVTKTLEHHLKKMDKGEAFDSGVMAVKYKGKFYIEDGHHQVVAHALRGDTKVDGVLIIDLDVVKTKARKPGAPEAVDGPASIEDLSWFMTEKEEAFGKKHTTFDNGMYKGHLVHDAVAKALDGSGITQSEIDRIGWMAGYESKKAFAEALKKNGGSIAGAQSEQLDAIANLTNKALAAKWAERSAPGIARSVPKPPGTMTWDVLEELDIDNALSEYVDGWAVVFGHATVPDGQYRHEAMKTIGIDLMDIAGVGDDLNPTQIKKISEAAADMGVEAYARVIGKVKFPKSPPNMIKAQAAQVKATATAINKLVKEATVPSAMKAKGVVGGVPKSIKSLEKSLSDTAGYTNFQWKVVHGGGGGKSKLVIVEEIVEEMKGLPGAGAKKPEYWGNLINFAEEEFLGAPTPDEGKKKLIAMLKQEWLSMEGTGFDTAKPAPVLPFKMPTSPKAISSWDAAQLPIGKTVPTNGAIKASIINDIIAEMQVLDPMQDAQHWADLKTLAMTTGDAKSDWKQGNAALLKVLKNKWDNIGLGVDPDELAAAAAEANAKVARSVAGGPQMKDLKYVQELSGSTKPYKAKHTTTGEHWVVKSLDKSSMSEAHMRSEALTDQLYRSAGFDVPDSMIIDDTTGPAKVARWIDGGETLGDWQQGRTQAEIEAMYDQISEGFVADALFANHDVAGMDYDNIFIADGIPHRIDNGGGLLFRAQGAPKDNFGPEVLELVSMRDPKYSKPNSTIFGNLTDAKINKQINRLLDRKERILAHVDDPALRATLAARFDFLEARLPKKRGPKRPRGVRRAEYEVTDRTVDKIKKNKSNGYTLAVDVDDIEDHNVLVWQEFADQKGTKRQTVLSMKLTNKGSDIVRDKLGDELTRTASVVATPAGHPMDYDYLEEMLPSIKNIVYHSPGGAGHGSGKGIDPGKLEKLELIQKNLLKKRHKFMSASHVPDDVVEMLDHYLDITDTALGAAKTGKAPPSGWVAVEFPYKPPAATPAQAAPKTTRAFRANKVNVAPNTRAVKHVDGEIYRGDQVFGSEVIGDGYAIDAGDGIVVRFVPVVDSSRENQKLQAMQGTLEIQMPGTVTKARIKQAMTVLEDLGINSKPPTPVQEELLYLHRGFYQAHRSKPGRRAAGGRDHVQVYYDKIWEADIPDEEKLHKMKAFIKTKTQMTGGKDVDKMPGYDPHGVGKHADGGGHRVFYRWDINRETMGEEMKGYVLQHTTQSLSDSPEGAVEKAIKGIGASGGEFTSSTGRVRKGVSLGAGDSTGSDMRSGGGSYWFTRIKKDEGYENGFFFDVRELARQDSVSFPSDEYGAINRFADARRATAADYKHFVSLDMGNESNFKEGFSWDQIDFIRIRPREKAGVLKAFDDLNMTHLPDGRPVEEIITTTNKPPARKWRKATWEPVNENG